MNIEPRQDACVVDIRLVDLGTGSLGKSRSGDDSALANLVERVMAEADSPEPLNALGWSSAFF